MKNIITVTLVWLAASTFILAQQLPMFTIYRDAWNVLNPAFLSNNYLVNEQNMSVGASLRKQWWGVEDGPQTQLLNWEYVSDEHPITTGAFLVNDKSGVFGQTGFYGQFAYRIEMGRRNKQSISAGLHAGMVQYRAKLSEIDWKDNGDHTGENDYLLYPDFGLGLFYHYEDKYYAGVSMPQIFGLTTTFKTAEGKYPLVRSPHFYAVAGGYFPVTWFNSSNSFLEPSVWLRAAPHSPPSFDLNLRYQIIEVFWAGLGGGLYPGSTFSGALHFEAGTILGEALNLKDSQLKIGFGFDLPIGLYQSAFGSSMEVHVVYSWVKY